MIGFQRLCPLHTAKRNNVQRVFVEKVGKGLARRGMFIRMRFDSFLPRDLLATELAFDLFDRKWKDKE